MLLAWKVLLQLKTNLSQLSLLRLQSRYCKAETTINYVITDTEKKRKFVCVDAHDIPVVAIIDPEMMSSMPKGLTASTGLDALTHAIEGYTTLAAWELADTLNLKAIEIISRSLRLCMC